MGVTLEEITFETVREVAALKVNHEQQTFVASNALSIAEAHFNPGAWVRKIAADDKIVGFVMLLDPTISGALTRGTVANDEIFLWRFMVDHHHQRKGYGRLALDLICEHLRQQGKANRILSSYIEGPHGPEQFYMNYGFRRTGHLRNSDREIEIAFPLERSA